jgi:hypothetical protein
VIGEAANGVEWHFPVMIAASLVLFVGLLRVVLGPSVFRRRIRSVVFVSVLVVVGGMLFGKYGATSLGLPWWIYYPVPAILTVVLAPLVFRMTLRKTAAYVALSALSAPAIHILFSFFLGWGEYMPFLPVPALASFLPSARLGQ